MAYQRGGYATPADFGDRKLSRLTVDTRKRRHHDRFRVRQLDHPRRRPPNVDLSPREYCARPSVRSPAAPGTTDGLPGRGSLAATPLVFYLQRQGLHEFLGVRQIAFCG